MQQYALIMRHEDGGKIASPEQMQEWMQQTMNWINGIASQNKFVSGTGLPFDNARVVTTKDNKAVVTNGPFGERCWSADPNQRPEFKEVVTELKAIAKLRNISLQR